VPDAWKAVYAINPMVGVIEGFRSALLGTMDFPWLYLGIGSATAMLFFVYGLYYFGKTEKTFADIV
jgi:lipopolysaccharide transport system permease protein